MVILKRFLAASLGILLLVILFSCQKKVANDKWDDTIDTGFIRIASDENFKHLMDTEIDAFEAHNNQAIIVPIYTTEKEAIRLLLDDSVRFALTTRDLTAKEKAEAEERKMIVNKSLIAFDGIAIVANVQNQDSVIGLPVLRKILTGEIKNWDQINSNSPLGAIRVLFEGKESGVLRYVVDSITRGDVLSSNLYVLSNSSEVLEKVIQMPNAIGMIGFNLIGDESHSDYIQMRDKIRLVWVGKEEQATVETSYLPYAGDILSENYPLWRPVYALLADPRSGLSSGFSIFLAHDVGQKVIQKSGLLPVTNPHIMQVAIRDGYPQNTKK